MAVGVLPRVPRRFWALTVSLVLHATLLVGVSMVSLGALPAFRHAPEPLFVILGPEGRGGGGGITGKPEAEPRGRPETRAVHSSAAKQGVTGLASATVGQRTRPAIDSQPTKLNREAEAAARTAPAAKTPTEAPAADTTDRPGVPRSISSAAASSEREAGDGGAKGGGRRGGSGALAVTYEQTLAAWLSSHKYYPSSLRRRGIEGEGKLRIRIARSGHVLAVDVAAAFPHPALETISQDWVKRAQPFPPVPDTIPGDSYVFIVPVGFRLQ